MTAKGKKGSRAADSRFLKCDCPAGFAVVLARVNGVSGRAEIELCNHFKAKPALAEIALAPLKIAGVLSPLRG